MTRSPWMGSCFCCCCWYYTTWSLLSSHVRSFAPSFPACTHHRARTAVFLTPTDDDDHDDVPALSLPASLDRRSLLLAGAATAAMTLGPGTARGAVGSLPDLAATDYLLQGLTVNVADRSQFESMIAFLRDSFDFTVLRQRQTNTDTSEVWLGYGPEELSIPNNFVPGPSSFALYGGHASLHLRYDAKAPELFYNGKGIAPGNNIAFLQVGVPTYRISKMTANGGNVLDAFGIVDVVSPAGLPMRGIVGIRPDPVMLLAVNTPDVARSRAFYEDTLGMTEQPYPYARPSNGTGQFEPPQPQGSVYVAHTPFTMGVLLLPLNDNKKKKSNNNTTTMVPNPVVRSLNVLYAPSSSNDDAKTKVVVERPPSVTDPSQVTVTLTTTDAFSKEVKVTEKNPNFLNL